MDEQPAAPGPTGPESWRTRRAFWGWWVLASLLGGGLAGGALEENLILGSIAFGALVALPQWRVLQRRLPNACWWVVVTALAVPLAWLAAVVVGVVLYLIIARIMPDWMTGVLIMVTAGVAAGLLVGVIQLAFLNRHTSVAPTRHDAGRWLLASALGGIAFSPLACRLFLDISMYGYPGPWLPWLERSLEAGLLWGAVYGSVTGLVLANVTRPSLAPTAVVGGDPVRRRAALALGVALVLMLAAGRWMRRGDALPLVEGEWFSSNVDLAFSPDGAHLAVTNERSLQVWRVSDRRLLWAASPGHYRAVAWSPDGRWLVSDGRIWAMDAGRPFADVPGPAAAFHRLAWSADGTLLAAALENGTVEIWRMRDGASTLAQTLSRETRPYSLATYQGRSVAFSPDSKTLAVVHRQWRAIQLWNVPEGHLVRTLEPSNLGHIQTIAFSPNGRLIAACGDVWAGLSTQTRRICPWQASDGVLIRQLAGHHDRIHTVAFSPDGAMLASSTGSATEGSLRTDNDVRLWRVHDGQLVWTYRGHRGEVTRVAFSPDGQVLASGSRDGSHKRELKEKGTGRGPIW